MRELLEEIPDPLDVIVVALAVASLFGLLFVQYLSMEEAQAY